MERSKKYWTGEDVKLLMKAFPLDGEAPDTESVACGALAQDMGRSPGSIKWKWYELRQEKAVSKDPVKNALATFRELSDENKALRKENEELKRQRDAFISMADNLAEEPPAPDIIVDDATGKPVIPDQETLMQEGDPAVEDPKEKTKTVPSGPVAGDYLA